MRCRLSDASIADGIDDRRVDDSSVVNTITAANRGFAVARYVVGKTEARSEIVLVCRQRFRLIWTDELASQVRQRIGNLRLRQLLVLVTHTKVDGQARRDANIILEEEVVVGRADAECGRTEGLLIVTGVASSGPQRSPCQGVCEALRRSGSQGRCSN